MDFVDSLLALSDEIGWEPVDIFFFCIFFSIFLWEFIPWFLSWVIRGVVLLFRWLRSRWRKAAD